MSDTPELFASYLEAGGTISAVLVALFLPIFTEVRRRPRLTLDTSSAEQSKKNEPEASYDNVYIDGTDEYGEPVKEYWMRCRVIADPKRRTAKNVQAIVTYVERVSDEAGNPCAKPMRPVVPAGPLVWSSVGAQPQSIPAGMWRRLDVLRYRIVRTKWHRQLEVEVGYEFGPEDERTVMQPGMYDVYIELGADDINVSKWKYSFRFVLGDDDATDEDSVRRRIDRVSVTRIN